MNNYDIINTNYNKKINIINSDGDNIESINIDLSNPELINNYFNKFINNNEKLQDDLKNANIIIIYKFYKNFNIYSQIIYSYYNQIIGNKSIAYIFNENISTIYTFFGLNYINVYLKINKIKY